MLTEQTVSLIGVLATVSLLLFLFLALWELGKDKEVQTNILIALWTQRILTIFLGVAYVISGALFSLRMVP